MIRKTKEGFAIISDDSHVGKWVEDSGTIEIAAPLIDGYLKQYIPSGGTVLDIGSNIGDHAATYSRLVGPTGLVVAFEPMLEAHACLTMNMQAIGATNVAIYRKALGRERGMAGMAVPDKNYGASYIGAPASNYIVPVDTLDDMFLSGTNPELTLSRLDFVKIDAEGAEVDILLGGASLIRLYKPVMYIEVNEGALARQGRTRDALTGLISSLGYETFPKTDGSEKIADWRQFDVICLPRK